MVIIFVSLFLNKYYVSFAIHLISQVWQKQYENNIGFLISPPPLSNWWVCSLLISSMPFPDHCQFPLNSKCSPIPNTTATCTNGLNLFKSSFHRLLQDASLLNEKEFGQVS